MNVKVVYYSVESDSETELVAYANQKNQIYISIDIKDYPPSHIVLDRSTAIRLAKDLRREISYLKNEEVNNG